MYNKEVGPEGVAGSKNILIFRWPKNIYKIIS